MAQKPVVPQEKVLQAIRDSTRYPIKEWVSSMELAQMLFVSDRTARRYLNSLVEEGKIERVQTVMLFGGVRFVYRVKAEIPSRGGSV